jgi:hypothetical protein
MDDSIENGLLNLHKKFKSLWLVVLLGMLVIIILAYMLFHFQWIELTPLFSPADAEKVTLVLIIIIVIGIFYLKKSHLVASKIKQKSQKYKGKINREEFAFLTLENEKHAVFAASVIYLNRIFLIVWFLADLIVLIAFVNFILALNPFLIYSLVGLYSLIANYPTLHVYKKLYNYIVL